MGALQSLVCCDSQKGSTIQFDYLTLSSSEALQVHPHKLKKAIKISQRKCEECSNSQNASHIWSCQLCNYYICPSCINAKIKSLSSMRDEASKLKLSINLLKKPTQSVPSPASIGGRGGISNRGLNIAEAGGILFQNNDNKIIRAKKSPSHIGYVRKQGDKQSALFNEKEKHEKMNRNSFSKKNKGKQGNTFDVKRNKNADFVSYRSEEKNEFGRSNSKDGILMKRYNPLFHLKLGHGATVPWLKDTRNKQSFSPNKNNLQSNTSRSHNTQTRHSHVPLSKKAATPDSHTFSTKQPSQKFFPFKKYHNIKRNL